MNYGLIILIAIGSLFVIVSVAYTAQYIARARRGDPTIWEGTIRGFEKSDEYDPPPIGGVVFTGSSSIRFWKTLEKDMAPLKVVNRGFGGSQIYEITHYADRIVLPYKPRGIVFYAGENDMAGIYFNAPKTPSEVREDFRQFCESVHASLPNVPIYFISIKPPKRRIKFWEEMKQANQLILGDCQSDKRLHYIDIVDAMKDTEGQLRTDLFKWDGIHLNEEGYQIWTAVVKPVLIDAFGSSEST